MADVIISPNMSLPIPVVGVDPGPDWATNINASLSAIDSHNHTAGQGVQITPAGLNINVDLPLNNNNLITARTLRFQPQVSAPGAASDIGCLTEVGVDLYYIDGSGNQIRITQSGSLAGAAGTITGLPSGTASASFAAGTFTFQSATSTPAALNVGPVTIGQAVASGFGVTLSAAVSQSANYNIALPAALPAATQFVTLDSSGNIGASVPIAAGITNTMLAPTNVSGSPIINSSTSSSSFVLFGTFTLAATTAGILKYVCLQPGDSLISTQIACPGGSGISQIRFLRDGTEICRFTFTGIFFLPPSCFYLDQGGASGDRVYTVEGNTNTGSSLVFSNVQFKAFEV